MTESFPLIGETLHWFYLSSQIALTGLIFVIYCHWPKYSISKGTKQLPNFLKIAETNVVLKVFKNVICDISAYTVTVSFCCSTGIRYQKNYILVSDHTNRLEKFAKGSPFYLFLKLVQINMIYFPTMYGYCIFSMTTKCYQTRQILLWTGLLCFISLELISHLLLANLLSLFIKFVMS
jgi:hypothetical protein